MINFVRITKNLIALIVMLSVVYGCGQPAQETAAPAVAKAPAQINERGVNSIDADGNVAPFGMASRQPVEIVSPAATAPAAAAKVQAPGENQFSAVCSACHGADATGVQGLGLDLVASNLVASSTPEQLVDFLKAGRSATDETSVTGMAMPAFNWMPDQQLTDIATFLKSLH